MKYFARQLRVDDYPHNGRLVWGVLDSQGGFTASRNEQEAIAEALVKNAQMQTEKR